VLFGSPVVDKVHALNVGARQLTTMDRAKIVHTITRLSKVPSASKYTGQVLYRILQTYLKDQIKKCYRTYFHSAISRATIINYGLNKKEDFSPEDFKVYNPSLLQEARRDLLVRLINIYTLRGLDVTDMQASLAKVGAKTPVGQPVLATPTITPTPQPEKETTPVTDDNTTEETGDEDNEPQPPTGPGTDDFGGTGYE